MRERTRRWLPFYAIIVVCAVLLAGLIYAFYFVPPPSSGIPSTTPGATPTAVQIQEVDLIFTYVVGSTGDHGYLQPVPVCGQCPQNVSGGADWNFSFGLNNTDRLDHNITAIGIDAPFNLVSVQPRLPLTIKHGGYMDFVLTILTPSAVGVYSIQGSITAD